MPMASPQLITRFGYSKVYRSAGVVFWAGKASIDADGCPRAYHPVSAKGLDALGNAGRTGNWYGVATHNGKPDGKPVVQGLHDPAPGFYVSTTSLQDRRYPVTSPMRYVDSVSMPFFVLPGGCSFDCKLGDLGLILNTATGKHVTAIYADIGPRDEIGEVSIAAAVALGIPASARTGGVAHGIVYAVFPGLRSLWPKLTYPNADWVAGINACVRALDGFGVIKRTLDV
jgi:hypothetical protein